MFGRKKKEQEEETEEVYQPKKLPRVEEELPEIEPGKPRKLIGKARIIAIELLESGMIRTIVVSNKPIGEIGEEQEI